MSAAMAMQIPEEAPTFSIEDFLEAEQAKFEVGASTAFFIIQYQSLLGQAESTVVVAKSAYLKARAALQRAGLQ